MMVNYGCLVSLDGMVFPGKKKTYPAIGGTRIYGGSEWFINEGLYIYICIYIYIPWETLY